MRRRCVGFSPTGSLLDELRLLVPPIVVGHGQRLFDDASTHTLELVASSTLSTGVLSLTDAPVP